MLEVFVPKEGQRDETRVAATPETVKQMVAAKLAVTVEADAGGTSYFADKEYEKMGAKIAADAAAAWKSADVVLKVAAPTATEAGRMKEGALLVGLLDPYKNLELAKLLVERKITAMAMELVPRITRAQKMDVLSSQASIAGYKAVILAAAHLPKYFPLLMTAAGTIKPARVVVMGAGVAGLQAIATAKRLGAVVHASDIRAAVKEQIESLGGKFIPLPESKEKGEGEGGYARQVSAEYLKEQQQIVREYLVQADAVICTAQVPGKKAPILVPAETVAAMKAGAVIVDIAVAQGGNCELSELGKNVTKHGVLIIGHPNLPASMPHDASLVYARNVWALFEPLSREEKLTIDPNDEVVKGCLWTHEGKPVFGPTIAALVPREDPVKAAAAPEKG